MKVTLNKANKIRNQIEALSISVVTAVSVRTDQSIEEITKALESRVEEVEKYFLSVGEKINFLFTLREMIQAVNHENGINRVIGEIAKAESTLRFLNNELEKFNPRGYVRRDGSSKEDAIASVKFIQEKNKDSKPEDRSAPQRINVELLDDTIKEKVEEAQKSMRLTLSDLQEKRNELNHKTLIELPEDMVEFLKRHSIV